VKLVLHNYWRSSASYRVRIGLGLKQLPWEYAAVNIILGEGEQKSPGYRALNPMAQVPTLEISEDDGTVRHLQQSLPILEYLEDRWPEPRLLPADPYLRARARGLAEIVNSGIQPLQNLRVLQAVEELGGDKKAWATKWISTGLDALEVEAHALAGRYAIGDRVTIADLFLVPQIYNARRFDVDMAQYPTLSRIERACNELPPFHAAHPDRQPDAAA